MPGTSSCDNENDECFAAKIDILPMINMYLFIYYYFFVVVISLFISRFKTQNKKKQHDLFFPGTDCRLSCCRLHNAVVISKIN